MRLLQFTFIGVILVGALVLFYAHSISGWSVLTYFVWGMIISFIGLIGSLITSIWIAAIHPESRRCAIGIAVVATVLLLGLVVLWRIA